METINELSNAVGKVVEIANKIGNEVGAEIYKQAPRIIHQRFCGELVEVAKNNIGKSILEVPRGAEILTAIDVLESFYPELKK